MCGCMQPERQQHMSIFKTQYYQATKEFTFPKLGQQRIDTIKHEGAQIEMPLKQEEAQNTKFALLVNSKNE